MNDVTTAQQAGFNSESIPLAGEIARSVGEMITFYEQHLNLTRDQALDRIHDDIPEAIERIRTKPPNELTYIDLYSLGRHSPELANQRRAEMRQAARSELRSGHRAASLVSPPRSTASACWLKVRLLVMHGELLNGWQPRNSIERLLVDTLMQVQCQYENWLEELTARTTLQAVFESKEEARWQPPRVTDSEAIEQAAAMVERFHRIMMRTIRQLQNLRRNPLVMVQNAGQVNVGEQQVNVSAERSALPDK